MKKLQSVPIWYSNVSDYEFEGMPELYWELDYEGMGGNYCENDLTAVEMLQMWSRTVSKKYPNGMIPIQWYATLDGKFERAPYAFDHFPSDEPRGWLIAYGSDRNVNWLECPVKSKKWFITQATGWKPSALQPFVWLPSLLGNVK